jgi:hypothetical protein
MTLRTQLVAAGLSPAPASETTGPHVIGPQNE